MGSGYAPGSGRSNRDFEFARLRGGFRAVTSRSNQQKISVATGSCSLPHVLPVPLSLDLRPWDGVREAVSLLSG